MNARSGVRTSNRGGVLVHQHALPIVELRYVISAWTSDHGDERGLLSGVMRSLLTFGAVPREFLPPVYAGLDEPVLTLARAGEDHMDVFKALEGQLKPGLNVVLSTEFDTGAAVPAGPPVGGVETAIGRMNGAKERRRRVAGEVLNAAERGAVGAIVRAPHDMTTINSQGQFLLRADEGDEIVVEIDPNLVATVPANGGVRFE